MSFSHFIYMLGAVTFAAAVSLALFYVVHRIEHPRYRR